MDAVTNPYSPGAGRPPVALVGRDEQIAAWDVALRRVTAGRTAQSIVLYGLRGVGKTVLLSEFERTAVRADWVAAKVEAAAGRSLREAIGEALHGSLADMVRPNAGVRLLRALKTALSFKASYDVTGHWSFGLDLSGASGGGADTGTLETDLGKFLHDVAAATAEDGRGLALLIDEAQDLTRDELTAVCAVVHRAGQDGWNLLVTLAGLPSLPRELSEAKSYSERLFSYAHIEQLEDEFARRALTEPAWVEGVSWSPDAVDLIVAETSGYPYFLQQFGQDSWNEAVASPITWDDARVGAAKGRAALDTGFFRARWDRATRSEQRYLRVMAADGDNGSSSGVVAERLGKRPTSLGPTRASLIAKGLVFAPEHGIVAFTVPAMAAFIQRQPSDGSA